MKPTTMKARLKTPSDGRAMCSDEPRRFALTGDLASNRRVRDNAPYLQRNLLGRAPGLRVQNGFTLIEVLIALAIFVMMAVVLGMAYSNVLTSYEVAARATRGDDDVRFARAALLAEAERDAAELGAEFDGANGRRVRWKAVIEPTNVADLFTVTFLCEINAPELPKAELTQEVFRLLRPTWSEPADRDKLKADAKTRIQKIQQGLANK